MPDTAFTFISKYWPQLIAIFLLVVYGTQAEYRVQVLENKSDSETMRRLDQVETMANAENMRIYGQLQKQVEVNSSDITNLNASVNHLYQVSKRIPFD